MTKHGKWSRFCKRVESPPLSNPRIFATAQEFCLSSKSEVAKPLAGRHAKSLTNIKSAFTSESKTYNYELKLRNI